MGTEMARNLEMKRFFRDQMNHANKGTSNDEKLKKRMHKVYG